VKKQKLCLPAPPPPPTVPSLSVHQDEDVPENGSAVPSSSHDVTALDHGNADYRMSNIKKSDETPMPKGVEFSTPELSKCSFVGVMWISFYSLVFLPGGRTYIATNSRNMHFSYQCKKTSLVAMARLLETS